MRLDPESSACGASVRGWMDVLDDSAAWRAFDPAGMVSLISAFPRQCEKALELASAWPLPSLSTNISQVVVAGMGGSAAGGDLLQSLADKPVVVSRGYEIPTFVDSRTVFFAVSYSGDTEETLSAYRAARERSALVLAIASGGKLAEMADADGVPLCRIPPGQPPRSAFGYLSVPLLLAAQRYGIMTLGEGDTQESLAVLNQVAEECGPMNPTPENPAKQLALALRGFIPIIYGAQGLTAAVALRWKAQFNENAKIPAFSYSFPEMNHNEIMGWEGVKQEDNTFVIVILRDGAESPRIGARFEITKSLIKDKAPIYEAWSRGNSPLGRAMHLNYFGDWVTVYSALLRGVDPSAIHSIRCLKDSLSKI